MGNNWIDCHYRETIDLLNESVLQESTPHTLWVDKIGQLVFINKLDLESKLCTTYSLVLDYTETVRKIDLEYNYLDGDVWKDMKRKPLDKNNLNKIYKGLFGVVVTETF